MAILTRRNPQLNEAGCLLYEVGVNDEQPDTVFVAELWTSADAHQASLQLDSVRAAIQEAMPLLSGEMAETSSPSPVHRCATEDLDLACSPAGYSQTASGFVWC